MTLNEMLSRAILIIASVHLAGLVCAAPPQVVKAEPDNGDVRVDPGLKRIRITFDQDMAGGMSVVGGGETYPEIVGRPKWVNKRTIVISVKLRPNHEYWLSVNNDRFRNFTNQAGEPAVSYPIRFRTTGRRSAANNGATDGAANDQAVANRRAYETMRAAIRDHYSYRDRLGIDWDQYLSQNLDALIAAPSAKDFAQVAGTLLARAEDKHIWLRVGDETIGSYMRPSVPNANFQLLPRTVPHWKMYGKQVASGRWDDGIGYLFIGSWSGSRDMEQAIFDGYDDVRDARALVIDVRGNGGGAEPLAQQFAGCFVNEPQLYGKHVYRDANSKTGFSEMRERWLQPNSSRPHFTGRVAVLTGPAVMSSCESFLLMMKTCPSVQLVGGRSQGSSGNPKPHDLGNGVILFLPSWKDMTADGIELEGVGVAPDIVVDARPEEFAATDAVLEAALNSLRGDASQ